MFRVSVVVENTALDGFRAEHGMAFHIETPSGHRVLFDTGDSGDVLLHNMAQFELEPAKIDAIVLSHAHYDHTGGLEKLLPLCQPDILLYAHERLFQQRYSDDKSIGIRFSRQKIEQLATLQLITQRTEIVPGVWLTGEITSRPYFEGRGAKHHIRVDGEELPDPYIDDFSVQLRLERQRSVVLLGCGHAGLLNILSQIQRETGEEFIAVAGGSHLISATDEMLTQAVQQLRDMYGAPRLYLGHCTGKKAITALRAAFADLVQPCPAGTVLEFA